MSDKNDVRKAVKERIAALAPKQKAAMCGVIAENFFGTPEYARARSIFFYFSTSDEPDTKGLIGRALAEGKDVFLPRIEGDKMVLVSYREGATMQVNRYGIEEPTGEASAVSPDLAVIPLVAFDRDKHRLGRGKGYYDRFLAGYAGESVALSFSAQECPQVPTEYFDVSPKVIVTEREVIR